MGNDTAHQLVAGTLPQVALDFLAHQDRATTTADQGGAYRSTGAQGARRCPRCDGPLQEATLPGDVTVDLCTAHGTFFDRAEVSSYRFGRAIEEERKNAEQQAQQLLHQGEVRNFHRALRAPDEERRRKSPLLYLVMDALAALTRDD